MEKLSDSGKVEERIRAWYQKGIAEPKAFDAYICLWIAFNGYYYAYSVWLKEEYVLFRDGKKDSENQQIKFVAEEFCESFQEFTEEKSVKDFFDFQKKRRNGEWWVMDLAKNELVRYTKKEELDKFLSMLYQIRCNLFHGWKHPDSNDDEQLVEKWCDALKCFLEKVLQLNMLNDHKLWENLLIKIHR